MRIVNKICSKAYQFARIANKMRIWMTFNPMRIAKYYIRKKMYKVSAKGFMKILK